MKKLHFVRTTLLAVSLLLQLSTFRFHSRGAAGDVDLSFDPGSGVNGTVNAIAVQTNGKVIIGGEFTTVKGLVCPSVARLNADGSGDSSFNLGVGNSYYSVRAIVLQPNGKLLVAHYSGIARHNFDGSRDTNFNANLCSDDSCYVSSVAVQSDGKVLVGGNLATFGTNVNYGIARLNANGSLDTNFNAGIKAGVVSSIALQPDGKVLVGGDFSEGNGLSPYGIARLNPNGSLDSSFNADQGSYGVRAIALQPDGKVLIGGYFTTLNGTNLIYGIARLNFNGSLDGSFKGIGAADVFSIAVLPDGKVLIGGYVTNRISRLNVDGSRDSSFNPGAGVTGNVYDPLVNPLIVQSDGRILIGGSFTAVNRTNRNNIARLHADGSLDGSFYPGKGFDVAVSSLVLESDAKVLVGGVFTFINGTNRYGSARLNADGSPDSTFSSSSFNPNIGVVSTENDYNVVTAAAVQLDGKVLISGYTVHYECDLDSCNIYPIYFLNRVNAAGSRDGSFLNPNLGTDWQSDWNFGNYGIKSIVVEPNGKVLIGGNFFTVNGTNRNGIARLNASGSLEGSFNPSIIGGLVTLQPDGNVLINGRTRLNTDGSLDGSFNSGAGANGTVWSVALQPDGKVLIGGAFTTVNGTNRIHIARLNANGSLDSTFNPGTGADGVVRSIALQTDGKVLIGGDFLTVNGVLRPYVARLYGDSVAPSLNIARSNAAVIVSWPVTGLNFQLHESTNLALPNSWSAVAQSPATNAGQISVTVPMTAERKFFRLRNE